MSSDFSDFLGQIGGLIAVTIFAGISWVGLMVLIVRRNSERRRRRDQGLEPLPSFFTQAKNWLDGQPLSGGQARSMAVRPAAPPSSRASAALPVPPLESLTVHLPSPGTGELTGDILEFEYPDDDDYDDESEFIMTAATGSDYIEVVEDDTRYDDDEYASGEDSEPPAPIRTAAAGTAPTAASTRVEAMLDHVPEDAVEIMALWRDLNDGKLIIDLNGQMFASAGAIKGTKYEKRFTNVVRELVKIAVDGGLMQPLSFKEAPVRVPPPPPPAPTAAQSAKEKEEVEAAPTGIAGEIEQYLQQRLQVHPEFNLRNIHVRPAPGGGVSIEVDDEVYEAVSDVADDDIRSFLQQVMEDWSQHR